MPTNSEELAKLLRRKQLYFLPFYRDVVAQHPEGVLAADVKDEVARQLRQRFGIDISDPEQCGLNPSTQQSRADQWANNLVSNQVLDKHMLVVRSTRATLFPGVADNSRTSPPSSERSFLTTGQISELNERKPVQITVGAGMAFQRSLHLAEYVRGLSERRCVVNGPYCAPFDGRDGRPYVEVHHLIPMAMQSHTIVNLDRVTNMVPLCPRCHTCLHRGGADIATAILTQVFRWIESVHHQAFSAANGGLPFGTDPGDLLTMYGLMSDI